jgi:putative ABC transport system permease protein
MRMLIQRLLLLLPWRRRAAERDMRAELRAIAAMADPRELGNLTVAAEDVRTQWGWIGLEQTAQDVRYAIRTLRKAPGFTLAAVASLAIGIGANTALFTLTDSVMWKLLPIDDPEHLLTVSQQTADGVTSGFTYPQYEIFRDQGGALDLAAYGNARLDVSVSGSDEPTVGAHLVTGRYFPLLGLRPAAGRLFNETDDRVMMGHPVAVLSHRYWQGRFAGDPAVIGRSITVAGLPFTIVGVAPAEFFGVEVGQSPDLYLPVMMQPGLLPTNGNLLETPDVYATWLQLVGRLKPGVSLEQAPARLNALAGHPATEWRVRNKFSGQFEETRLVVRSAAAGLSDLRRQFSQPLFVLLGVAGLVLLIACANVGHLLLARSATRRSEFALRLALGAGRARVMRQVIVEGLVLAGVGAVVGVALAYWSAPALVAFASAGQTSVMLNLLPDLRVLAFTTVVSILAGLLFASAPAFRAARADQSPARLDAGRSARTVADRGPGKTLVVIQVALSVVLLVTAGQFVRTLQNLYRHDSNIDLDRVVVVRLEPRGSGRRTPANAPVFDRTYRELVARVEALPGVRSASLARSSPLGPSTLSFPIVLPSGGDPIRLQATIVYPRYFATIGVPIVKGRDFNEDDLRPGAAHAVIVNDAFVREILNDGEPLGTAHGIAIGLLKAFRPAQGPAATGRGEPINIVGVVKDSRFPGLRDETPPRVYQTYLQANTGFGPMVLHVRATRDSAEIVRPVTDLVRPIEREVPMATVHTLADEVNAALARERLLAALAGIFGLVALSLISVGLYGLMAFSVSRRTPEIGIRIALGATRPSGRWLVGRQALGIVLAGVAIGIPAAWIAGRLASRQLSSLLYKVTSTDPATMALATIVLVVVAMSAGLLPARRAVRIDPAVALRND